MHPVGKFPTLYIDGIYLPRPYTTFTPWEITPDSQHLISIAPGLEQNMTVTSYYVDGDLVAKCSARNMTWFNSPKHVRPTIQIAQWGNEKFAYGNANHNVRLPEATDWEMQPDGSIIFVCATPGPAGYGPIKKWTVTPAPGSNITSWVASLPK